MKMNSIEEKNSQIEILKQALNFYANRNHYKANRDVSICSGTPVSLIEMDEGMQARFAIDLIDKLNLMNQQMENEMYEGLKFE